jgi:hypothetical protein
MVVNAASLRNDLRERSMDFALPLKASISQQAGVA